MIDQSHKRDTEQDRNDRLLVIHHCDSDAKDSKRSAVGNHRNILGSLQDAAHDGTQRSRNVQLLGGGVAQQDGHVVEAGIIDDVKEDVGAAVLGNQIEHGGSEQRGNDLRKAGDHQDGNQRSHRAGEVVQDVGSNFLRRQRLFRLIQIFVNGGMRGKIAHLADFGVNLGNILSDDNLILSAGTGNTQNTGNFFDFIIHRNILVF